MTTELEIWAGLVTFVSLANGHFGHLNRFGHLGLLFILDGLASFGQFGH